MIDTKKANSKNENRVKMKKLAPSPECCGWNKYWQREWMVGKG